MTRSIVTGALGATLVCLSLTGVQAAPSSAVVTAKAGEATASIQPVAAIEREDDTACSRARRRLWIEGEGWVVRRITTCR